MSRKSISLLLTTLFLFNGCTLAPWYERPEMPVEENWPSGKAYKSQDLTAEAPLPSSLPWHEFFKDERLKKVIDIALENNRDLRKATLNVEKARASYGIQRAELLPIINGEAQGTKQREGANVNGTEGAVTIEQYRAKLNIPSWEIDFFGRIQSLKDSALEEFLATEEARRATELSLISEVSSMYISLAAQKENLLLAESTLRALEESANLVRRRYEVGVATELDLRQAESRTEIARSDVALYTRLVAQNENALNFLLGASLPPELLPQDLLSIIPSHEISAGLSSEALLNRPDILAAEHLLKASNANIGAARAAFLPRISLTTSIGTASGELSNLFKAGSDTWVFTPQIVMPIFDPRTWSALDLTEAARNIVLADYEKALQKGFREVADVLATQGTIDDQLRAQESFANAARDIYRLSNSRYLKGIDSYLIVLDAQRSQYEAEKVLISVRLAHALNRINLYAVLGGGVA